MNASGNLDLTAPTTARTISSLQPANTKPKAFILNLPTEILNQILLIACEPFPGLKVQYKNENGNSRALAQALVLRHVSRRFRSLTNELDFWYREAFEFWSLTGFIFSREDKFGHVKLADLGIQINPQEWVDPIRVLTAKLTKVLFNDEQLTFCLGRRKTDWRFSYFETMCAVLDKIPLSHRNMRKVTLFHFFEYNVAIDQLRKCKFLTKLSLDRIASFRTEPINLSLIGESWPFLQELRLSDIHTYTGSIANFENLQNFYISFLLPSKASITAALIPEKSVTALTNLTISKAPDSPNIDCDLRVFRSFVNLNYLHFDPPTLSLFELVAGAQFKLSTFSTRIALGYDTCQEYLLSIFSAKCLKHLDQITLVVELSGRYTSSELGDLELIEFCEQIIQIITKNLQSLQILTIYMPLHISWCQFFERMTNLKLLSCSVPPGLSIFQHVEGFKGSDKEEIKEGFKAAFAGFVEKPRVDIRITEFNGFGYPWAS